MIETFANAHVWYFLPVGKGEERRGYTWRESGGCDRTVEISRQGKKANLVTDNYYTVSSSSSSSSVFFFFFCSAIAKKNQTQKP